MSLVSTYLRSFKRPVVTLVECAAALKMPPHTLRTTVVQMSDKEHPFFVVAGTLTATTDSAVEWCERFEVNRKAAA